MSLSPFVDYKHALEEPRFHGRCVVEISLRDRLEQASSAVCGQDDQGG